MVVGCTIDKKVLVAVFRPVTLVIDGFVESLGCGVSRMLCSVRVAPVARRAGSRWFKNRLWVPHPALVAVIYLVALIRPGCSKLVRWLIDGILRVGHAVPTHTGIRRLSVDPCLIWFELGAEFSHRLHNRMPSWRKAAVLSRWTRFCP